MTDIVKKFEAATLTLQQKQGCFNRKPEPLDVVAMLNLYGGLKFVGNKEQ